MGPGGLIVWSMVLEDRPHPEVLVHLLIAAAGSGRRMGAAGNKLLLELAVCFSLTIRRVCFSITVMVFKIYLID